MKLKQTTYKTIEIIEDDEYGMVIGNIVMDDSKLLYAEIVDSTICERSDLEKMRAFLDEVDNAMPTETFNMFIDEDDRVKERLKAEENEVARLRFIIAREYAEDVKMRNELDECSNMNSSLHENIEYLKNMNIDDLKELYDVYEEELSEKQEIIDKITSLRVDEVETLYNLKAELSAHKEDSDVLMNVVDIVRDDRIYPHGAMNELTDLLVDYLNAIEDSTDSGDNTSYTVKMGIRCE